MATNGWSETDATVLQVLANVLACQNREEKAADLLEYVLHRDAENTDAMRALCGVYLMLDRYQDALSMVTRYEKAVSPNMGHAGVLMVKGQALWEMGLTREATDVMNTYLSRKAAQSGKATK